MNNKISKDNVPFSGRKGIFFKRYQEWNLRWRVVKALRNEPVWDIIQKFQKKRKSNISVFEVGCGNEGGILNGCDSSLVKKINYLGIDPKINRSKVIVYEGEKIRFIKGYAGQKIVPANSQDIVVCIEVLEHLPAEERIRAIESMLKVAKTQGLVIVSYPVKGTTGTNEKVVRDYIASRKRRFGESDFVWDLEHFRNNDYHDDYLVPGNSYMNEVLREIEQRSGKKYNLITIPNINIHWWKFLYSAQYGVYPILHLFSRILFSLTFFILKKVVHYGETFRIIYCISKETEN